MHWMAVFAMDDPRHCLKSRLPGAYFGGKPP
jgi:hypothetical protein